MRMIDYTNTVMELLETFDYPDLIFGFDETDVARSMSGVIARNYVGGISPMMCAIMIWSLTMNYQILNRSVN